MKLKTAYETEIYISEAGYLAIKQPDPMGGDPSIVILSPDQARRIAEEIVVLQAEQLEAWDEDPEDGAAAPQIEQAAARQPKTDYLALGAQIRSAREDAGLTHELLAQTLGITQQSISDWERGLTSPTRQRMDELRRLLPKLQGLSTLPG
jgi:DNA-binding transcriptional regulator YiaG